MPRIQERDILIGRIISELVEATIFHKQIRFVERDVVVRRSRSAKRTIRNDLLCRRILPAATCCWHLAMSMEG
jgi:hypothetical protein